MTTTHDRRTSARTQLRRQFAYLLVASIATAAAALAWLHSYGPLTATPVITVLLGVVISIMLGGGLMAMGFYSAASGVDDVVARPEQAGVEPPKGAVQ